METFFVCVCVCVHAVSAARVSLLPSPFSLPLALFHPPHASVYTKYISLS